jgi:tetratricopeptide (TPR) repeat protein
MRSRKLLLKGIFFLLLCISTTGLFAQGPGAAFFKKAEDLRKQKQYPAAVEQYNLAIKAEGTNPRYHFGLGRCYNSMQEYDNAILSFQAAVDNKSDFTSAYVMLANCYKKKNDNANAIYNFDQAFNYEKEPSKKITYKMEMVKLLLKEGKKDEAANAVAEAKSVDPNNLTLLYYEAKLANEAGDYQTAKDAMTTASTQLENMPSAQSAKYYYELGYAYYMLADYTNSQKAWEQAYFGVYKTKIDQLRAKNNPAFFYRMAVSYFTGGDFAEARAQIEKALELQNNFSAAYSLLAKIAKKEGNYTQAITNYESAAEMEGDPVKKSKILTMLVALQLDAGDHSGALKNANEILGTEPGNAKVLFYKAQAQYELGQYGGAISNLESLIGGTTDNVLKAKYNFLLGLAAKNTDPEMAKNAFKAALFGPYKPAAKNEYDKIIKGG